MIRRAKIGEIPQFLVLTHACARHMIEGGISQGNEHYPSGQDFIQDIFRNEISLFEEDGKIVVFIAITTITGEKYTAFRWLTETGNNLYIHRLAVQPDFQGRAYAQKLMSFGEAPPRERQYDSIRLDTFSKNYRNQRFCQQKGYLKLGDVFFPRQSEFPFYCYELILK